MPEAEKKFKRYIFEITSNLIKKHKILKQGSLMHINTYQYVINTDKRKIKTPPRIELLFLKDHLMIATFLALRKITVLTRSTKSKD